MEKIAPVNLVLHLFLQSAPYIFYFLQRPPTIVFVDITPSPSQCLTQCQLT